MFPRTTCQVENGSKNCFNHPFSYKELQYSTRIGVNKLIGYITPIYMAVRSSKLNVGHKYLLNDTLKKDHTSFIMTRKNE
jgi:hypothetical protein